MSAAKATRPLIPIARPMLGQRESAATQAVLESGELAQGRWVAEFEEAFARFCGAPYAIATSSGTTALHLALLAHGIGPGDEVITTPFTFIASSNAILYVGARPVFADIDPSTYNIDPAEVEQRITPRTRAVLAVDLYGQPADLPGLGELCRRHKLVLIEDASQSHGAQVHDRRTGSFGTGTFSFYPSKNMTTGEGGMITTDDPAVAEAARVLRHHGTNGTYLHGVLGFNHRMTNLQAAIGLVQLERLPEMNARRRDNAAYLTEMLADLSPPRVLPGFQHVYHQYTLRVPDGRRDAFAAAMQDLGVETRVYYPVPVHQQPVYQQLGYGDVRMPESERAAAEVVSIPVHPGLTAEQLEQVARAVRQAWSSTRAAAAEPAR